MADQNDPHEVIVTEIRIVASSAIEDRPKWMSATEAGHRLAVDGSNQVGYRKMTGDEAADLVVFLSENGYIARLNPED